jgi:tetratricopeptide (TPR) repeat protein
MDQAHGSDESHETTEGHGHGTDEHAADEHASIATGAVPDPIDRVSLGNNLYALGEYPAAYKAYLSANPEELTPEQQFWVEYQIANCLRRMGEHAEASNRFRKLAGQPEAGWLSERAGWWVDVLEQIRRTENALKQEKPSGNQNQAPTKLPISSANKGGSLDEHGH